MSTPMMSRSTAWGAKRSRMGGQLRLLSERMTDLSWQPDGYQPADLGALADALQGMALRCAMSTGNTRLMTELTGRHIRKVNGDDL